MEVTLMRKTGSQILEAHQKRSEGLPQGIEKPIKN